MWVFYLERLSKRRHRLQQIQNLSISPFCISLNQIPTTVLACLRWCINHWETLCMLCIVAFKSLSFISKVVVDHDIPFTGPAILQNVVIRAWHKITAPFRKLTEHKLRMFISIFWLLLLATVVLHLVVELVLLVSVHLLNPKIINIIKIIITMYDALHVNLK